MKTVLALLALCMSTTVLQVHAEGCLNDDPKRGSYPSGDPRNSTYVRCSSGAGSAGTGQAGAVGAIGSQLQNIIERRNADEDAETAAWRKQRDYNWENGGREQAANRFKNLKWVTAHEARHMMSEYQPVKVYPNADIPPEQRKAIQAELLAVAESGKLLETYGNAGFDDAKKAWLGSADPVANRKVCEVGTQLVRSFVYGEFIPSTQKNPAKGFAIARAGCTAFCGGTCYELGRIFEGGDAVAPGVDKVLGKDPALVMRQAYDVAIVNGEPGALEREAEINWRVPARYVDKEYYDWSEFSSRSYWINGELDRRLAYQQFRRCLKLEPANITCARDINAFIEEHVPTKKYYLKDVEKEIDVADIAYYRDYLAKLEKLMVAQTVAPATAPK